jgi:hypothetical protein
VAQGHIGDRLMGARATVIAIERDRDELLRVYLGRGPALCQSRLRGAS